MSNYYSVVVRWLGSRQFFILILLLFVVEATWLAVSGRFPMAFDEDFHLGIIQIYSHHLSPFFAQQPLGADIYGAVARDPSYLYHYLMSFPWRLITHLNASFMVQVIFMRLINAGLFASSLVLFRRLLSKTNASKALIHLVLLFLILTPIVPLVAAQINYDNLLIPLTALSLLLSIQFSERLRQHHTLDMVTLGWLAVIGMAASLVKYAFLPIFLAIFIYVIYQLVVAYKGHNQKLWLHIVSAYRRISMPVQLVMILALIISSGLFIERYAINVVRYDTPIPECNQVLSVKQCTAYGAWNRNYIFKQTKAPTTDWNPTTFSVIWARKLAFNLLFALNGIQSGFAIGKPVLLPRLTARATAYIGLPLLVLFGVNIFRDKTLGFLLLITVFYVTALWLQNYSDYLHLGQQVAVQGRYLLPILPALYLMIGLSFARLLRPWPSLKLAVAGLATACLILGGGALTFILHSDSSWYWPNWPVISANQTVQHVLTPVIPDARYVPVP